MMSTRLQEKPNPVTTRMPRDTGYEGEAEKAAMLPCQTTTERISNLPTFLRLGNRDRNMDPATAPMPKPICTG